MVNIKNLDKATVLVSLWNYSHGQGMSFLGNPNNKKLTLEKARFLIEKNHFMYFDYVLGRVIKVDLSKDEFDPRLYDRDCGEGQAQKAIDGI